MCGEQVEQQQADDELRRRDADETQHHDHLVGRSVAPGRRVDAGGQAEQQLEEDGGDHELQRGGQAARDQLAHLGLLHVGPAEIALDQVAEIAQVLRRDRLVEAELTTN